MKTLTECYLEAGGFPFIVRAELPADQTQHQDTKRLPQGAIIQIDNVEKDASGELSFISTTPRLSIVSSIPRWSLIGRAYRG